MDPEDAEIAKTQGANKRNSGSASPWLSWKSRWDKKPATIVSATPGGATPAAATPTPLGTPCLSRKSRWDETPSTPGRVATPTPKRQISRWDEKPATMGGSVTPTPAAAAYTPGVTLSGGVDLAPGAIQMRAGQEEEELTPDEQKEREIWELVFKFKNETHPQWEIALGQLTDRACQFGAGPLFNYILPLFSHACLQVQERRLLVKVIDRVLYKLGDLVKPYVHEILVVIKPLLVDEDYNARVEGRAIISSLSKVAGLDSMIAAMRPDIDDSDECVRNTAARGFSVVASALGVPALLHFLKAVCQSRNNWQSRHTGIKIVHQIAVLIGSGSGLEPHLKSLVEIVKHGLNDENEKVRTITALSLAALAIVAAPDGIKSFDSVVKPLCEGIKFHRGKVLAAFLKAIGFVISLMDAKSASIYTKEVMVILIREFQSPDEDMKKIVLKVVKQCMKGLEADFIRTKILPEFYRNFWVGMAFCPRNRKQLIETTVEIANKAGVRDIVARVAEEMKDESEPYRRMVIETIEKLVGNLGPSDIDDRLEELLIDGIFYAFLEQSSDDANVMLNGFGAVVNSLGQRVKPYLPQICGAIEGRLKNERAKDRRQQAADLISRIAVVMEQCHEEQRVGDLGVLLYESLGEENPEVLGSILGALKATVNVTYKTKMATSIKELLPRLTPLLKNRHEKVQENCIDLVGHIIDRGAEFVHALELMRICFDLVEMLKSNKKGIRLAAVNTFGDIAKAIGPQDVLAKLLNSLKVQERRNRVCTTVAMSIVAEKCSPGIVLTALMNEYWGVPELNDVQNWVLKSLSFLFEYISEPRKEYVYVVIPLLEDALKHPDAVHRQGAAFVVKHMALRVVGLGCEDGLVHILNYLWPNIFETSPFVLNAVMEAIEGMRVALGAPVVLNYCLQGLFHPSRKVREVYWKIYNSLYIGAQDALVAAYPVLEDEGDNVYSRPELTMFV